MKKIICFASVSIFIILAAVFAVFLIMGQKTLGNMSNSFSEPKTITQSFSFSGKENHRIKIEFSSDIKSGDLEIQIIDSKGNTIKSLDKAKELRTYLTLDRSEIYTCEATCSEMIGALK